MKLNLYLKKIIFLRYKALKIMHRFFSYFGIILISKKKYTQICLQRYNAFQKLANLEDIDLQIGLVGVVFSKDRAIQLYALLTTYFAKVKNPVPIFIIYSVKNKKHKKSYAELETLFKNSVVEVRFICEQKKFKSTLVDILDKIKTKNIFFLVDDIIFIRNLDLTSAINIDTKTSILSLRLSPQLRYSYTLNCRHSPPKFSPSNFGNGLLNFNWFKKEFEWSDPWSLDGHVLSTAEVRVIARLSNFKAPNSFENALKLFDGMVKDRIGICFSESKILNLPINRVQNENVNLSGNISSDYLLEQWNKYLKIDTDSFDTHTPTSTHEEHSICFKRR